MLDGQQQELCHAALPFCCHAVPPATLLHIPSVFLSLPGSGFRYLDLDGYIMVPVYTGIFHGYNPFSLQPDFTS